jgi:glycosyltransferase involved in cell wall biosynthesis
MDPQKEELPTLSERRFCIFVPCYHTAKFLDAAMDRIPWDSMPDYEYHFLFVDNASTDNTWEVIQARVEKERAAGHKADAIRNPRNLSYGGSCKVAIRYCRDNDLGLMVVLHSDGQYAPEELPRLIGEFIDGGYTMFFGSRLTGDPLAGGMPKYKYYANHALTWIQNAVLGTDLSEFHSGLRFYRINDVIRLPFEANSDYFDYDNHIIFQIIKAGGRIGESTIPTHYGDETSYVDPIRTPVGILTNIAAYVSSNLGLVKIPRYNVDREQLKKNTENRMDHDLHRDEAQRGAHH